MGTKENVLCYFMDLSKETSKNARKIGYAKANILEDYYFMLGCACQGRIDEYIEIYKELLQENITGLEYHLNLIKPHLDIVSGISKELEDNKKVITEQKDSESLGECMDRLLKNNIKFITSYNTIKSIYLKLDCKEI